MTRVEKGLCKLDLWDSSMPRVEKGPCKLNLRKSSVPRVEKGLCKLESRGIQVCKELNKDYGSMNHGILIL